MHKLNRLFTVALSVTATAGFALYGCQSLWDNQLINDPNNCAVNNVPCEVGFVCDTATKHCVPEVADMAGVDAASSGIDGGTMIDMSSIDMAIDPSPFVVQAMSVNTSARLNAVYGKSGGQVWAVGENSTLLSLESNATNWQLRSPSGVPQPASYQSVWTFDGSEVWLGGSNFIGALAMPALSLRNALNPGVPGPGPALGNVISAWGYDAVNVFFTDESGRVYQTDPTQNPVKINGCNSFDTIGLTQAIWGAGADKIWTVGAIKSPYTSVKKITTTACGSFIAVPNNLGAIVFRRIHGIDESKIWLTSGGSVYTLNAAAPSFVLQTIPSNRQLNGIWAITPMNVWAVGDNGTIIHYDGTAWTPVPPPVTKLSENLRAVWADANHVYIVGDNGTILSKK